MDPSFTFNAEPDPDRAPHKSETNLRQPSKAPFWASKAPSFYFIVDPDPPLHCNVDPDLQPWLNASVLAWAYADCTMSPLPGKL